MNNIRRLCLTDAIAFVAGLLKMQVERLGSFFAELGEQPRPSLEQDPSNWSMPQIEAAMLYAIVRAIKPNTVLELGTHLGYSAEIILKGLIENDHGNLITLERQQHLSPSSALVCSGRSYPLSVDGIEFSKSLCFPIDMIFEDGDHTEENTRTFLTNCLPHLTPGGVVVVHDVAYPGLSETVTSGMVQSLGDNIERIVIDDSPCGLGLWIKAP